jgi:hypothetical protein
MVGLRTIVMLGCLLVASLAACAPPEVPEYRRARPPVSLELPPAPTPAANEERLARLDETKGEQDALKAGIMAEQHEAAKVLLEDGRDTGAVVGGEGRAVVSRDFSGLAQLMPDGTVVSLAPSPHGACPPPPADSPAAPAPVVVHTSTDREAAERATNRPGSPPLEQPAQGPAHAPRMSAPEQAAEAENERVLELGARSQASPEVLQVLRGQRNALQRCYDALVLRAPATADGNVTIRFTLSPAGEVQAADVVGGTLEDADFRQCVVGRLQGLTFPRADSGTVFTYPFRFGGGPAALGADGE